MEFFKQEYWSGLPFPTAGHLPNPETEAGSLSSPAWAGGFFTTGTTWEAPKCKGKFFKDTLFLLLLLFSRSVASDSLWPHEPYPSRLLCPRDSPGQNTGVGSPFLLQGIIPTQGLNPRLPHWQVNSLSLSHQSLAHNIRSHFYGPTVHFPSEPFP